MTDPTSDPERRLAEMDKGRFDIGKIEQLTTKPQDEVFENIQSKIEDLCGSTIKSSPDDVNHPSHYCNRDMEAIDIIEMIIEIEQNPKVAYNLSNVLKYLLRFRDKGKPIHDLKKAIWYLNRTIQKIEEE